MSALKREKRLNKNGVLVTKLVRDDASNNDAALATLSATAPTLGGGKPAKESSTSNSWNPLNALKERKERKANEKAQRENLFYSFEQYDNADDAKSLVDSIKKPENVDKALVLVEQFERFGGARGDKAVRDLMKTIDMDGMIEGESTGLRAMYAHRDYLDLNPARVSMFGMGVVFLKERELDRQQEDGRMPAIERIIDSANDLANAAYKGGSRKVDMNDFFTEAIHDAVVNQRVERNSQ